MSINRWRKAVWPWKPDGTRLLAGVVKEADFGPSRPLGEGENYMRYGSILLGTPNGYTVVSVNFSKSTRPFYRHMLHASRRWRRMRIRKGWSATPKDKKRMAKLWGRPEGWLIDDWSTVITEWTIPPGPEADDAMRESMIISKLEAL